MDDSGFRSSSILIAGLGLIGGSVARALHDDGFMHIDALDADLHPLAQAKKEGVIRAGYAALQKGEYDLVLCCLPPGHVAELYEHAKSYIKAGGVFAELSGLKTDVIGRLTPLLAPEHELLSLHPMAGSEKSGYANSDAGLFKGAPLIITPTTKTSNAALAWAVMLRDSLGFAVMPSLTADRHDEIIARVSHLPHAAALAVRAAALPYERYAGGSYQSVTRVADINAALWAGLLTDNAEYVVDSIRRCERELQTLREAVKARDKAALQKLIEQMSGKGGKG
jgi:prephenate dehydrogenase